MEKVTGCVTEDMNFDMCSSLTLQSRTESKREVWERSLYCCYQFSCNGLSINNITFLDS